MQIKLNENDNNKKKRKKENEKKKKNIEPRVINMEIHKHNYEAIKLLN